MRPSLKRARMEQKKKALQLLTLSGAVRPANIEARYRGSETVLGVAARPQPEMPRQQDSIWWMDLTALFKALQARQLAARSRPRNPATHAPARRSIMKRPATPSAA